MPRVGVTTPEVAAAFEKLLREGETPTAEKIRALLGKSTVSVIEKHLKQMREQSRLDLVSAQDQDSFEKPANLEAAASQAPLLFAEPEAQATSSKAATPAAPTPASLSLQATTDSEDIEIAPENTQKRFSKRERFNQPRQNHNTPGKAFVFEEIAEPALEDLSDEKLLTKVRRLESILMKEQMRRELAEKITEETKDYAESIKEQVGQRINDLRENMSLVVEQLKTQLREQKDIFDHDVKYYQEQLSRANEKIATLLQK